MTMIANQMVLIAARRKTLRAFLEGSVAWKEYSDTYLKVRPGATQGFRASAVAPAELTVAARPSAAAGRCAFLIKQKEQVGVSSGSITGLTAPNGESITCPIVPTP